MSFSAAKLVDWDTAGSIGDRVAGSGAALSSLDRARLAEDFAEVVPRAESLVEEFTGLSPGGYRSRAWVMTRSEWLRANLRGFQRVLEPFADKVLGSRPDGPLAPVRRHMLGAQVGGLLGYLGHRVLGQYDVFLPPDDDGLIYFVGPNVAGLERKFGFPSREFRLWISLHEVTHRLQFGGVPWLRGHLTGLMDAYLSSVELDPRWLVETLRRALDEVRSGAGEFRGLGWIFLLMSPDQRAMVKRMQAMMSLLEGHGNYVMNSISPTVVPAASRFQRTLHERRHRAGMERVFQKAIGFDVKVRQYDLGERFVARVVQMAGMAGFNRVWQSQDSLPTIEEIASPEQWVARVATA
jgi:coenzyme F420 biosynthesis associated uncharacterized protein